MKKDKAKAAQDDKARDAGKAASGVVQIASVKPKIGESPDHVKRRSKWFSRRSSKKK